MSAVNAGSVQSSMARTLFVNVNILDCSGAAPFPGEVLVEGNRILSVAMEGEVLSAPDVQRIDGRRGTLMPGLIEPHAHLSFTDMAQSTQLGELPPEDHAIKTLRNARVMLDHGFTSCFGAASAKPRLDIAVRDAINRGDFPGPRMLAASPEMTVTGGLGDPSLSHLERHSFGYVCDGADAFRRAARLFVREGVDTLKINISGDAGVPWAQAHETVMTDAEVEAVCEVARSRGKRVAAHARSAESVKMALRHGVEVIYHATLLDDEACAQLEAQRERVFVAPTLGNLYAVLNEASAWGITRQMAQARGVEAELLAGIDNMRALQRRGVRVLPGGDYGFAWAPIGSNARDIEHFVKLLGFTPMDAVLAATRLGGEIMRRGDELGQIKEGYLADLIVVDGDPLSDVALLRQRDKLRVIMKDGVLHKCDV